MESRAQLVGCGLSSDQCHNPSMGLFRGIPSPPIFARNVEARLFYPIVPATTVSSARTEGPPPTPPHHSTYGVRLSDDEIKARTVAFQMAIVLNYIQNLIDWGDSLFAQFTREMITQATQLYILADKLLGPKPAIVKPAVVPPPETFNQIQATVDILGNDLIEFENLVSDLNFLPHKEAELPSSLGYSSLYFCIPPNYNMISYWDLVADRLFKIRNCENIDGIVTPPPLFSPPIDPAALVRAAASGISPGQIASGISASLPIYRFNFIVQRTAELVQTVSGLGSALLQALERQDAEQLARLQSSQQLLVLNAVKW